MGAHQLLGALDNCSPGETATAYKSQSWIVKSFAHRAAATGLRGEHALAKETQDGSKRFTNHPRSGENRGESARRIFSRFHLSGSPRLGGYRVGQKLFRWLRRASRRGPQGKTRSTNRLVPSRARRRPRRRGNCALGGARARLSWVCDQTVGAAGAVRQIVQINVGTQHAARVVKRVASLQIFYSKRKPVDLSFRDSMMRAHQF